MKRSALVVLAAASPLALGSLLLGGAWADRLFPLLVALFPLALIAAATAHHPHRGWRGFALAGLAACLVGGTATLLVLEHWPGEPGIFVGLPAASWVMLVGMGIAPLVLVAVWHLLAVDAPPRSTPPDGRAAP